MTKKQITFRVLGEDELPLGLRREPMRMSSNPLRVGEPCRGYGAQTHIWGKQPDGSDKKQLHDYLRSKELQNIIICMDDINHLIDIIKMLPQASDYTNKLLGKYFILELSNIITSFGNLAKTGEEFTRINQRLKSEIKKLDNKFKFLDIRNKLAAHRHHDRNSNVNLSLLDQISLWNLITSESLQKYLKAFQRYVDEAFQLAPLEQDAMSKLHNIVFDEVAPPTCSEEYVPFYQETKNWKPKTMD